MIICDGITCIVGWDDVAYEKYWGSYIGLIVTRWRRRSYSNFCEKGTVFETYVIQNYAKSQLNGVSISSNRSIKLAQFRENFLISAKNIPWTSFICAIFLREKIFGMSKRRSFKIYFLLYKRLIVGIPVQNSLHTCK